MMCHFRSLREKWESFSDELSDAQRDMEVSALQWSSFDENAKAFQTWISEADAKLKLDADLKATLQEKKVQLHNHKVGMTVQRSIFSRKYNVQI